MIPQYPSNKKDDGNMMMKCKLGLQRLGAETLRLLAAETATPPIPAKLPITKIALRPPNTTGRITAV